MSDEEDDNGKIAPAVVPGIGHVERTKYPPPSRQITTAEEFAEAMRPKEPTHGPDGVRYANPRPPAGWERGLFLRFVDWLTVRILNGANLTRSMCYMASSYFQAKRWGVVSHEVAMLRALWCFRGKDGKPCESLEYDEKAGDFFCNGRCCGCGHTRRSRLLHYVTLHNVDCSRKKWGRGDAVTNPLYGGPNDGRENMGRSD